MPKESRNFVKREFARRLRKRPTPAEATAWELLRCRRILGFKFRRQHLIAGFIVDFCCEELKLVIELDGNHHYTSSWRAADAKRSTTIARLGYQVIRIPNDQLSERRLTDILSAYIEGKPMGTKAERAGDSPLSRRGGGGGGGRVKTRRASPRKRYGRAGRSRCQAHPSAC